MRSAGLALCLGLTLAPLGPAQERASQGAPAATSGGTLAEREKLDEILARREFSAARRASGIDVQVPELEAPSFLRWLGKTLRDTLKRWFDWWDDLFRRNRPPELPEGGSLVSAGSGPLTWVLVALASALLLLALYRAWRRRRPVELAVGTAVAPGSSALPDALSQSADAWASFADKFARDGQWRLALRALYLELLVTLHERGAIRYERQRTNGDYLASLRGTPAGAPFARLTAAFDLAWYGNKPFESEAYESALGLVREVDQATAPRAAA